VFLSIDDRQAQDQRVDSAGAPCEKDRVLRLVRERPTQAGRSVSESAAVARTMNRSRDVAQILGSDAQLTSGLRMAGIARNLKGMHGDPERAGHAQTHAPGNESFGG
jgi:hypothetical protein